MRSVNHLAAASVLCARLLAPALALVLAVSPVLAQAQPAGFDLLELQVEGNTVLPDALIEATVEPFLGPGQGMKGVDAARTALEAVYQKAGYLTVLVDVPEQRVDGGVVRLVVIEGRVGALYVVGSKYHDQGYIRSKVTELKPGGVPDFNRVQTQLAEVNRSEDRRVQPVLKPGRLPGTVDVELQVDDKLPFSGSVEVHNQHSAGTEPVRLQATLRYENLFQRDHALQLNFITAPLAPQQSKVLVANYTVPDSETESWNFSLTLSNSDVETLGGSQVLGRGTTLGLRRATVFSHHGGERTATLSWGADLKLLRERTVFGAGEIATPLHYLPFQLAYSDQMSDGDWRMQWNASVTAAARGLLERQVDCPAADSGTGQDDQFACKRKGGDGSFLIGRLDLRAQQRLGSGALSWRLGGQAASHALVGPEQYSLGGADSVRGYDESEATGDHALLGSMEWRVANLAPSDVPGWREITPLIFIDAGRVFTTDAPAGQLTRQSLSGAGFGLRWSGGDTSGSTEGGLDFAWPLRASTNAAKYDLHLHARLAARF